MYAENYILFIHKFQDFQYNIGMKHITVSDNGPCVIIIRNCVEFLVLKWTRPENDRRLWNGLKPGSWNGLPDNVCGKGPPGVG